MKEEKNRELRRKYMELAGMLKEKRKGNMSTLDKILAKFSLQEGLRGERAQACLDRLEKAGLVIVSKGGKRWKYNEDAEWELFKISVW